MKQHLLIFVLIWAFTSVLSAEKVLYSAKHAGKYGFIDATGAVRIPFQYDMVSEFSEGLALVLMSTRHLFIDASGNTVFDLPGCCGVWPTEFSEGAVPLSDYRCQYLDRTGAQLFPRQFAFCGPFIGGVASVFMKDRKGVGLVNKTGKVVRINADCLWQAHEGLTAFRKGDRLGFVNNTGEVVIGASFGPVPTLDTCFDDDFRFVDGLARVPANDGFGYIDRQGAFATSTNLAKKSSPGPNTETTAPVYKADL